MNPQAKHTPGPWKIRSQTPGWNIGNISGSVSIATVRSHCPNAIKDALLIAAAPDLLEACKCAAKEGRSHGNDNNSSDWIAMANYLEAAIAKAEGQEVK